MVSVSENGFHPLENERSDVTSDFAHAVSRGVSKALSTIHRDFENPIYFSERLAYHGLTHTLGVASRVETILQAIRSVDPSLVSQRDIYLGYLASASHDTVQNGSVEGSGQGRKRKRDIGNNEKFSAEGVISYMQSVNDEEGEIFTPQDMQVVKDATLLTIPVFDPDLQTVIQPDFGKYADSIVAQALALADLGGAGMEGFATAAWEADALFTEEHVDFAEYKTAYEIYQSLDDDKSFAYRDFRSEKDFHEWMNAWLRYQQEFHAGRDIVLGQNIASMKQQAQSVVSSLFSHGDEVKQGFSRLLEKRKKLDFSEMINDMKVVLRNPPHYSITILHQAS